MALPKQEILKLIEKGELISKNFSEKCLEPASYDIRLGEEGITSIDKKKINIKEQGYLTIGAGEFAVFQTFEYFNIPLNIVGNIGMKSKYARQGLILLAGLQIDPGFQGYLVLRAFNSSTQSIIISYKDPIGMVQFLQLIEPVEKPYSGKYQEQITIPAEDLEQIVKSKGMTIGEVILTIQSLVKSVQELKVSQENIVNSIDRMEKFYKWTIGFLTILISVVAIIAGVATIF